MALDQAAGGEWDPDGDLHVRLRHAGAGEQADAVFAGQGVCEGCAVRAGGGDGADQDAGRGFGRVHHRDPELQCAAAVDADDRGGQVDFEYRYSATQNNGTITQMKDWVSGEEVTYQYDELKRLASAVTTGPEWGLSFSFDGFGNRTAQTVTKGSAPASSLNYTASNNRLTGYPYQYDAKGNLTRMYGPGGCVMTLGYDTFNRLGGVSAGSCGTEDYAYGADGRRVWKQTGTMS